MKKQNRDRNSTVKKVSTVPSAAEKRAEKDLRRALSNPEGVDIDGWDEIDFGALECRSHKAELK